MSIFENRDSYLYVEGPEPYSRERFFRSIQEISDACKASSLDRFDLGKEIARVIGPKITVAVIANFNIINDLAENAAVNRGAKIKVFTDAHDAMAWLNINP